MLNLWGPQKQAWDEEKTDYIICLWVSSGEKGEGGGCWTLEVPGAFRLKFYRSGPIEFVIPMGTVGHLVAVEATFVHPVE